MVSTTEGAPSYGGILTTLSLTGDTSPAAGTTLEVAPSGGSFDYSRTFEMDQATIDSLAAGTHTVYLLWRAGSGTNNIDNVNSPAYFTAIEFKR